MHFSVSITVTDNENNSSSATNESQDQVKSMQEEINKLFLTASDLQSKLSLTCECLKDEIEKRSVRQTSKHNLAVLLKSAKKERDISKNKLRSCLDKFSHLSTLNINKRLKTQKDNVQVLKEKLCNQEGKIGELEVETKKLK